MQHRTFGLIFGLAALVLAQSASAEEMAVSSATIDPLVSLSMLATSQSQAAVCAGAAAANAASSVAAAQPAETRKCLLPISPPPAAPAPVVGDSAALGTAKTAVGAMPLLLGLAAIVGLGALIAGGGSSHDGVRPVSPA